LVRVRYTVDGELEAEVMPGFRTWLLSHEPSLAEVGELKPDAGGLNIKGLGWDPRTRALLFGLRAPAKAERMIEIGVPVDIGTAQWTTAVLDAPTALSVRVPQSKATQGIRDFRLGAWKGGDDVRMLGLKFHQSMKP
jgi:hypothetical protein